MLMNERKEVKRLGLSEGVSYDVMKRVSHSCCCLRMRREKRRVRTPTNTRVRFKHVLHVKAPHEHIMT